jgi:alanine racemase
MNTAVLRSKSVDIITAPAAATGVITVDLDVLASNWRALADRVMPAECAAVVKANAYGLGAERVIPALRRAGCTTFFIATADEGADARRFAPDATVFALDGLMPGSAEVLCAHDVAPVLGSVAEVLEVAAFAKSTQRRVSVALHLDTGLNRLGLSVADVGDLINERVLDALDVKLIMSHLACADDPAHPKNAAQRQTFDAMCALLPDAPASLAASDGLMLGPDYHYDLVRPGYAVYGGQAFKGGTTPVQPVVRVHARILHVRDVAIGETVGYAAAWTATRPSRIAIVAAGYADGFHRAASQPGPRTVLINDTAAAVIGRVSMDLIAVDVTDCAPAPQRGAFVQLIGHANSIDAAGAQSGTIGYEVLTSLSQRFHRVYKEDAHHG